MALGVIDRETFNAADRDATVTHIVLFGRPEDEASGPFAILHWRMLLQLAGGSSVTLNMIPQGRPSLDGVLFVRSNKFVMPPDAVDSCVYETACPLTVDAVLDFIERNNLHRYKYDACGSGCRWWCYCVLDDMARAGMVPKGSGHDYWEHIGALAGLDPMRYPTLRRGEFV
ncbi:hypothetical protein DAEQUDRAFT_141456 [Daedalea quercina L-15889]|uniref:DUF7770 domain-containing protein n=1 Tax=Daedalea quercina L-15889 TaxID=1314783 RepID=A0A165RUU8_9APHY|nr:hypothetical protein DAEQUDRAFT_141456 [Daedalea quercina L-15889]